ncbi:MAG: DUF3631 domain-containing protein [Nitrospinae bacterium]|nr:DUF3631 domain-containing protein [Nitrospinota bacterium]
MLRENQNFSKVVPSIPDNKTESQSTNKSRIVPFGIKDVGDESPDSGDGVLPQASDQPVTSVSPAPPGGGNTWTNYLQGAEGVERHKVAVELSKRYLDCDLTSEEVEFFLTDYARRCSPQMEPHEIHQIISNIPRNENQLFPDTVPWPDALRVDGVLNEIVSFLRRFTVIPQNAEIAIALWIVHVWCLDAFQISPLLRIKSPTKSCGKTILLSLIGYLLPKNVSSSNVTPAVLFRLVDRYHVSLCIDEVDLNFKQNGELVSLVNSGHRRDGANAYRCSGDSNDPTAYNSWSGKALAGIGNLKETTESRAIQILMRKNKKGEKIEKNRKHHSKDYENLKQKCRKIAFDNENRLRDYEPEIPQELGDRQADNWEPLLAIADLAGENWPAWVTRPPISIPDVKLRATRKPFGKGESYG